jgi:hypothetical protein
MASPELRDVERALVRFNAHWLGLTFAAVGGAGLFLATLVLVVVGGETVGPLLGQLGYFYPGYSVSFGGAFMGALWAGVTGYLLGGALGLTYGRWMLGGATAAASESEEGDLTPGIVLLRAAPFALVTGALMAAGLMLATNWLWFTTGEWSPHLFLLHNYMPGYEPTFTGSLVGGVWTFLYGAIAAGTLAWIYDTVVKRRHS